MAVVCSLDIGGTKIAAALVEKPGQIAFRVQAPTPREGGDSVVEMALQLLREVDPSSQARAVGIASAGVIEPTTGRVSAATESIPSWKGIQLRRLIESRIARRVAVINDVQAHALGEALFGAARGLRSSLVVAVGTGLGATLVYEGHALIGEHGAAGHFGHTPCAEAEGLQCPCGRSGHLESVASGPGLVGLYRRMGGTLSVTTAQQVVALEPADATARRAVQQAAAALGKAVGGLVSVLDPAVVVFAGGMRNPSSLWWSCLRAAMSATTLPSLSATPLVQATLGDDAALVGAASFALDSRTSKSA